MNVDELLTKARDAVHVSRVYGEPFEKNGVTVIPAAKVAGGGGGGTGHDETRGDGEGGGLGWDGRDAGHGEHRRADVPGRQPGTEAGTAPDPPSGAQAGRLI